MKHYVINLTYTGEKKTHLTYKIKLLTNTYRVSIIRDKWDKIVWKENVLNVAEWAKAF